MFVILIQYQFTQFVGSLRSKYDIFSCLHAYIFSCLHAYIAKSTHTYIITYLHTYTIIKVYTDISTYKLGLSRSKLTIAETGWGRDSGISAQCEIRLAQFTHTLKQLVHLSRFLLEFNFNGWELPT